MAGTLGEKPAQRAFGAESRFFAVGNPATSHERGLCVHDGISETKRTEREAAGIRVILDDQTLFQGEAKCDAEDRTAQERRCRICSP